MKEWYAAKELTGFEGMPGTVQGIILKAEKEGWRWQPHKGRGGGREYHISALPEEARIALLTPAAPVSDQPDQQAMNGDAPQSQKRGTSPQIDDLTSWLDSRRITLSPAQLADPKIQIKLKVARAIDMCPAYKGREKLIAALADQYNVTPITIRRWYDDVQKMHAKATPRIKLGDQKIELPKSHAFTDQALAFGLSTYANNMRSGMKAAYRAVESLASSQNWQIGDYVSFTRLVKEIPEAVWIRLGRGATGFELECVPKIIRQWTAVPVQSVLCGDQKIFDYEVYDEESGRIVIPNGYFWMDCASRMINGVWIEMGHYNSYTVGRSLREALHYGMPGEIFTDWGKPETSKYITFMRRSLSTLSTTGDFMAMEEAYGMMGQIEHRKAQAGKPWMKPIENIMNILDKRLAEKYIGGFRKRNNDAWVNKVIQANLKKDRKLAMAMFRPANRMEAKGLMRVEEFIHTVFTVVQEHNKAEKQLKEGGTIVPFDFFFQGCMSKPPTEVEGITLDLLCLPHRDVKPRNSVIAIKARSNDYRGYYSPALAGIKKQVRVFFDPYNPDAVAVITDIESGKFIDVGAESKWHSQNPYDKEGISHKRERQAEIMKWVEACANRVKEGFDLAMSELRIKRQEPVVAIGSASTVAKEAEKATKIYQLRQTETKTFEKDRKQSIDHAHKEMLKGWNDPAVPEQTIFVPPPEGKERYIAWLDLRDKADAGEPLSIEEERFVRTYQDTSSYRVHRREHEKFGEMYLPRRQKPYLQEVVQ